MPKRRILFEQARPTVSRLKDIASSYLSPANLAQLGIKNGVKPEYRYALRSAIRSLYPKMTLQRLSGFENFASDYTGEFVNARMTEAGDNPLGRVSSIREMVHNEGAFAPKIKQLYDIYNSSIPGDTTQLQDVQQKQTLRQRYYNASENTAAQTLEQQAIDAVGGEVFDLPAGLADNMGGKLELQNQMRERFLWRGAADPRYMFPNPYIMPFESDMASYPVPGDLIFEDMISQRMAALYAANGNYNLLGDSLNGQVFVPGIQRCGDHMWADNGNPLPAFQPPMWQNTKYDMRRVSLEKSRPEIVPEGMTVAINGWNTDPYWNAF